MGEPVIVGVGELLWDVYPDGTLVPGGAPFNFAAHCRQLGHPAAVVSRVGDDELGHELCEAVRERGVEDDFIQFDPGRPTGTVRVTIADGQPTYAIADDVAWDRIAFDDRTLGLAESATAVCYGTLASRSPESRAAVRAFLLASRAGILPSIRVADANRRDDRRITDDLVRELVSEADWVKTNADERPWLAGLFGVPAGDLPAWHRRRASGGGGVWLTTLGADGVAVETRDGEVREPGVPARVVDTVGAGDAFAAAMVCLHLEGRPPAECARFAVRYAARVCEHRGAVPVIDRAEVERT